MLKQFEQKCVVLFGECPLNIYDIASAKAFDYSEEDLLFEAAKKHYLSEQSKFCDALYEWEKGNKLQITREEAEKRQERFKNAKRLVDERVPTDSDSAVNWMAFPNDDPTICYYIGVPLDSELCVWASQYK